MRRAPEHIVELRRRVGCRLRTVLLGLLVFTSFALVAMEGGCVIVQPSDDSPRLPDSRPTIVHASVVPSTSAVLTTFPRTLVVPVELSDPTASFWYATFIDYNPLTGEGLVGVPSRSDFDVANTSSRTRMLTIDLAEPPDLDRCHAIEVVVASRFRSTADNKHTHTPEDGSGDIVTWFYNPNGGRGGCPTLDAGIDATFDTGAQEVSSQ